MLLTLEAVARELGEPLLRFLERYVGDHALAEELRQETMVRIARGLAAFEGRSSVKTWAFSIASRVAADHFRAPQRRLHIVDLEDAAEPIDIHASVEERIEVDEMNACVRQVIDSLPEAHRTALILHDLEGMPASQVAETCGCTLATAKMRIHRARARLRDAMEHQCAFYRDPEGAFRCDRKGSAPG